MDIIPLLKNLKIKDIFKDEARKEGDGITDALSIILQLLGEELEAASWLIKARSRMEPVELYDKE